MTETSTWPKRPDGSNMTIGEMTPEQRREQFRRSVLRIKAEFEHPATQAKIQAVLDGHNVNQ